MDLSQIIIQMTTSWYNVFLVYHLVGGNMVNLFHPDYFSQVHYPAEALKDVAFSDTKRQLLEAQVSIIPLQHCFFSISQIHITSLTYNAVLFNK